MIDRSELSKLNIDKSKLQVVGRDDKIFDAKFETKAVGYFADAFRRFSRDKAAIVGAIIILCLILFAIIAPIFNSFTISYSDSIYKGTRPTIFNGGFYSITVRELGVEEVFALSAGLCDTTGEGVLIEDALNDEQSATKGEIKEIETPFGKRYTIQVSSYLYGIAFQEKQISQTEYNNILAWEAENPDKKVLYPIINYKNKKPGKNTPGADPYGEYALPDGASRSEPEFWYLIDAWTGLPAKTADGTRYLDNYLRDDDGNVLFYQNVGHGEYKVRVNYYNYFTYKNGAEPQFVLGTDMLGRDIMARLAGGIQTSLLLAICVSLVNFLIGAVVGAIEGYYGGWLDMILERIKEIIYGVPFMVIAILVQINLIRTGKMNTFEGLLFAFVFTGWIGYSSLIRMQFYRFKHQEYVLASRTLGASDARLMLKHIFPNSLGTIVTSCALVIPSVIFSESTLSYLRIINFETQNLSSLGSMLSAGSATLLSRPHIILFPALVISLLMICFNLFGNGLRDAFNPTLRGAQE